MTYQKVIILNPWDSQGNQITDSIWIYPTVRGCGGGGYQQGYLLQRGEDDVSENNREPDGKRISEVRNTGSHE